MINGVNTTLGSATGTATGAGTSSELDKLKAVAKQFEAVFLRQVIGSSREAKLADDVFGSDASDQFQQMQDSHLADNMSEKGVFGIADLLVKQFAARVSKPAAAAEDVADAIKTNGATGFAIDTAKAGG